MIGADWILRAVKPRESNLQCSSSEDQIYGAFRFMAECATTPNLKILDIGTVPIDVNL